MKTLICIGDSLTAGTDIPVGHTWPELVSHTLNMDVINCGIGGDTTTGMLARFHQEVAVRRPAFVFIMGGTNDLWWGATYQHDPGQSLFDGLPGPPSRDTTCHRPALAGEYSPGQRKRFFSALVRL